MLFGDKKQLPIYDFFYYSLLHYSLTLYPKLKSYYRRRQIQKMPAGEVRKEVVPVTFHTYPLCKHTDMPEEMKQEVMEVCVTASERFTDNYENAARVIKDGLDKKFGPPFQVVVGEAYGSSITFQENSLLYMFTGGNIAILVWRTVATYS